MNNNRIRNTYTILLEILTLLLIVLVATLAQSQTDAAPSTTITIEVDVPMTPEQPNATVNHAPYFVYIGAEAI